MKKNDCHTPSVTAGVIKQISNPLYLYIGAGYSPVFRDYDYYSSEVGYYEYWGWNDGLMFDVGAIYKIKKFNIGLGYSISTGFDYYYLNHSVQLSVGYCF